MKQRTGLVAAMVVLLVICAFGSGCTSSSDSAGTESPTVVTTAPSITAQYSAGDIVKNPKSSSGTAILIIKYDAGSDMYERAYVYPNTDGSFGYRIDSKTDLISRSIIEKAYTSKVKTTEVSAIPIRGIAAVTTAMAGFTTVATTDTSTVTTTTTTLPAPRVKGISPDKGKTGTTVSITNLDGQNFVSGAKVALVKGNTKINATNVGFTSSALLTCTFVIPSDVTAAYWDILVTNPDGQYHQYQNGFLVQEGTSTVTTTTTYTAASGLVKITQVQDPLLVTGGGEAYKTVSILGTNLTAASGMKLTGPSTITASTYASSSSTTAIGYFTIPAGNLGDYYVNVLDASGNILATSTTTLKIQ